MWVSVWGVGFRRLLLPPAGGERGRGGRGAPGPEGTRAGGGGEGGGGMGCLSRWMGLVTLSILKSWIRLVSHSSSGTV